MGQKVNPQAFRIAVIKGWKSRWFSKKEYANQLREDVNLRKYIKEKLKNAAIGEVEIERSAGKIRVIIKSARPGVIIGRGGSGAEDIKREIRQKFLPSRKIDLKVEVEEIKNMEENAEVVGRSVAEQLEKRVPFRRILKGVTDQAMEGKRIKGIKIEISGRLGGADMSRTEWVSKGTLPLHTLRADIDFSKVIAKTTHGVIGVKVWIYRGDRFE
ncbi:MAG: 30S ribosomal protein S3 [Parcubacteria group bacterium]|jgi:small subunit ribosomal protein S3